MEKSANKRWKESGTTLSFKEWIDRENKKKEVSNFVNLDSSETPTDYVDSYRDELYKTNVDNTKILGLDKGVLALSTLLVVGSLTYYLFNKFKNKK